MEQISSEEINNYSATQLILYLSWNLTFLHCEKQLCWVIT